LEVTEGLLQPYGMQVTLCKSGAEAIEEVKSVRFDLVFMDQMMPEMDGIETVSNIRALASCDAQNEGGEKSYYDNVPIVALTADAVFGTKEMLMKNGFDDFLSKPIDTTKLNAILEKWIPKEKQKDPVKDTKKDTAADKPGAGGQDASKEIAIDGVNVKKGMSLTGGITKSYLKILSLFYKDGVEKIGEIKTCLEANNIPLYAVYVHALKSAAAIIGAERLSEAAKALEYAGKQGNLAFIQANNDVFIKDLETLLYNINVVLSREAGEGQKNSVDRKLLKTGLSRLRMALNAFDLNEINTAAGSLQEFTQAADIGSSIEAVLQKKLTGEYDEAVSMIDTLVQELG
jgi:CheY-like chemotaxis protein